MRPKPTINNRTTDTMTEHISRNERGARIERTDVSDGMTVIMEWSPYRWWTDEADVSGRVVGRVTDVCDISGDIVLEVDGETVRDYGEGRRYVSGRADFQDGVPSRTDVGTGARYYEVDE